MPDEEELRREIERQKALFLLSHESKKMSKRYINVALLRRNYLIGKRIDEEVLTTKPEDYGKEIIKNLPVFLSEKYGDGFTTTNLYYHLRFARYFPDILHSASRKSFLSWTRYRLLLRHKMDRDTASRQIAVHFEYTGSLN